jgi:hypothetical protein
VSELKLIQAAQGTGLVPGKPAAPLCNYNRDEAASALNAIADLLCMGSAVRDPASILYGVRTTRDAARRDAAALRRAAAEFAPGEDGEPDVGALVENIRALRGEIAEYETAYAASVGQELKRIAPSGTPA